MVGRWFASSCLCHYISSACFRLIGSAAAAYVGVRSVAHSCVHRYWPSTRSHSVLANAGTHLCRVSASAGPTWILNRFTTGRRPFLKRDAACLPVYSSAGTGLNRCGSGKTLLGWTLTLYLSRASLCGSNCKLETSLSHLRNAISYRRVQFVLNQPLSIPLSGIRVRVSGTRSQKRGTGG